MCADMINCETYSQSCESCGETLCDDCDDQRGNQGRAVCDVCDEASVELEKNYNGLRNLPWGQGGKKMFVGIDEQGDVFRVGRGWKKR
tara:strand:- start:360 stop:623 length:264 start_codon:yes stop_codon:yes gene_type:complete